MRLSRLRNLRRARGGFTLVEMLIVVPIALLVVAGLISAMVSMIGSALVTNKTSETLYNIQDTLGQIEQDARVSTNFMGKLSFFQSPQGKDNNTAPFQSSAGDLIMTQQATTTSPYESARSLIYYKNQPNGCSDATVVANRTLLTHAVYFLTSKSDGTQTLWRRVIMNPANTKATPDANTVCTTPWQRNSCAPGSTLNQTVGSACQSYDEELLDNVTAFTTTYYTAAGATTTNPAQAKSIRVAITVTDQIAGSTIAKTETMQVTRTNDVPTPPAPSAPVINKLNPDINSYNNPILTTVTWSAPNATYYTYQTKVGSGSWTATKFTTDTSLGIATELGNTVSIKVTAYNDTGASSTTTYNTTAPIYTNIDLEDDWVPFGGSTYATPSFTRTTAGIVVLHGLAHGGTSATLGVLPVGFRPKARLIFPIMSEGSVVSRVDILTDGTISWQKAYGGGTNYFSLDGIRFAASDFDKPAFSWVNVASFGCDSCTTPWHNYGGIWQTAQTTRDNTGRALVYGLVSNQAPFPPSNSSPIVSLSAGYQPKVHTLVPNLNMARHYSDLDIGIDKNVKYRAAIASGGWESLDFMYPSPSYTAAITKPTLQNGWVDYNGSSYGDAVYTKGPDDLVLLGGLIKGGDTSHFTTLFTLPSGFRPDKRIVMLAAGKDGSSEVEVRLDILPNGDVNIIVGGGMTYTNQWLSLENISFYADGN